MEKRICILESCGIEFEPKAITQVYCCPAHRVLHKKLNHGTYRNDPAREGYFTVYLDPSFVADIQIDLPNLSDAQKIVEFLSKYYKYNRARTSLLTSMLEQLGIGFKEGENGVELIEMRPGVYQPVGLQSSEYGENILPDYMRHDNTTHGKGVVADSKQPMLYFLPRPGEQDPLLPSNGQPWFLQKPPRPTMPDITGLKISEKIVLTDKYQVAVEEWDKLFGGGRALQQGTPGSIQTDELKPMRHEIYGTEFKTIDIQKDRDGNSENSDNSADD